MRKIILIVIILSFSLCSTAWANTTKVLERDTFLHPQGWIAGSLKFKEGTSVTLNGQGEVISGTLKNYEDLRPASNGFFAFTGWGTEHRPECIHFKGDTCQIVFNVQGDVVSGQIGEDAEFSIWDNNEPYVTFKYATYIEFDEHGNVKSGTITEDTDFRPLGWRNYLPKGEKAGFLKFKSGTQVFFGPEGQVSTGTIADNLTVNGITYPAGTKLQFSESGYPQKI
ncbi:Hypothetical protein LUCI_4880 [Lucifera butyrica]|uniref:Uncharacterized protein n=1 Tax=Lucifera butyrica TaxID=1351585 RepID=A0A498RF03_9FIRM|nr:hypothetical protein [Lucifera butyrica]VBB09585.1 Hypothetical protein LUCI_4880 [Lucifera butyrica]